MSRTPPLLRKVLRTARVKHFPKGQIIFYQGDEMPGDVFIIKSGTVKLYDINEQGNEKILHIIRSPALLPIMFFTGEEGPVKWFYATLTDTDVYALPRKDILQAMEADSKLIMFLLNNYAKDTQDLILRLGSLEKTSARDKLLASLRFLADHHAIRRRLDWWRVTFPVNHQLLADLSGVTRESASMAMRKLSKEKLVRNPRQAVLEINRKKLNHKESGRSPRLRKILKTTSIRT